MNLLTNMHSWYLQENISSKAHKHIHPGHHDQKDSESGNQGAFSTHTLYTVFENTYFMFFFSDFKKNMTFYVFLK